MELSFRLRVDWSNDRHVHVSVFAGPLNGTRAKVGDLVFLRAEYLAFARALVRGGRHVEADDLPIEGP